MNGRFITLEGIEGAGKSTVAKFVLAYLARREIAGRLTREPGARRSPSASASWCSNGEPSPCPR